MTKDEAYDLLARYVQSDWLKKHCLATAAVMKALAGRFQGDPELWWTAGLLHDLDFDLTQDPARHGLESARILRELGQRQEVIDSILAHNAEGLGGSRETSLDYALTCAETITGLVTATALVMPDQKLASVQPSSVVKRMKKKDFARKVSRERILLCEKIGLSVEELAEAAVTAMQEIAGDLGL